MKTFTSCWENKINEVSEDYFSVIKNVLKETTGWTEEKNKYLCSQLLKTYFFGYLIELPLIFCLFNKHMTSKKWILIRVIFYI